MITFKNLMAWSRGLGLQCAFSEAVVPDCSLLALPHTRRRNSEADFKRIPLRKCLILFSSQFSKQKKKIILTLNIFVRYTVFC